ncbi:LysE family translocator [Microtetraspora malaysiensis]|uniref:LysE family translocator n=1 Tax=Microtetraspora malaysiensis TaxID=161358 RepID=UPI003D8ED57D
MLLDPAVAMTFCLAALVISLVPGPDMLFIAATGLASGPRAGVLAALGMSSGLVVHTTAAALGFGALMRTFPVVFDVVRVLGAAYLLYLAVASFRSARTPEPLGQSAHRTSWGRIYAKALLTNLANPKVIAFYLAFFPQFVDPARGSVMAQFFVLGALFIVVGLMVDASAGLLAGRLGDFVRRHPAVQKWLHRVSGTIFAALAVRLATDSH